MQKHAPQIEIIILPSDEIQASAGELPVTYERLHLYVATNNKADSAIRYNIDRF